MPGLPIDQDAALEINWRPGDSAQQLRVSAGQRNANGRVIEWQEDIGSTGTWVRASENRAIGSGELLWLSAECSPSTSTQGWGLVSIVLTGRTSGTVRRVQLIRGGVGRARGLAWHSDAGQLGSGDEWVPCQFTGSVPAAGDVPFVVFPDGLEVEPRLLRCGLTASVAAANRLVGWEVRPIGSGTTIRIEANTLPVTASQSLLLHGILGLGVAAVQPVAAGDIMIPIGSSWVSGPGDLSTVCANEQAGDQFTALTVSGRCRALHMDA